jgi:hypothetical protein
MTAHGSLDPISKKCILNLGSAQGSLHPINKKSYLDLKLRSFFQLEEGGCNARINYCWTFYLGV